VNFKKQFQSWVTEELVKQKTEGLTGAAANIEATKKNINSILPQWVLNAWNNMSELRLSKGMAILNFCALLLT
jgi:hypothetical protein